MAEEIKRMNFFNGLFLTEEEFQQEQEYHLRMRRVHNRFFHGKGVVYGLEVSPHPGKERHVKITTGAAIDRMLSEEGYESGREIVLKKDTGGDDPSVDLSAYGAGETAYISIYYMEEEADVVQDKGGGEKIHIWEQAVLEVTADQPQSGSYKILLGKVELPADGTPITGAHITDMREYAGFDGMSVKTESLEASGDARIEGKLDVLGSTNLKSTTITGDGKITNDLDVDGNLNVDGQTTLKSTTIAGDVSVNNQAEIKGNLSVSGQTELQETTIKGNTVIGSTLNVQGDAAFDGQTTLKKTLVSGDALVSGKLNVGGEAKIGGNLTVDGDLVVNGDTTAVNAATLEVEDNIITANRFKPKTKENPNKLSGLEVFRGKSGANAQLVFDENDDAWKVGIDGNLTSIATIEHLPSGVSRDITQAGHGLKVGQAIRYDAGAKKYIPAIANSDITTGMFIVSNIMDKDNFSLVQAGFMEGLSGLKAGEYYYVSDKNAGELTNVEPLMISNPIFFAETESSGYVLPFRPSETAKLLSSQLWSDDGSGNVYYDKGNVGIGTDKPKEKLEVSGNINYSGTLNKLTVADSFSADIGCADFKIGHSSRKGSLGRALVDNKDTLVLNYAGDWKNTRIDGNVAIGAALQVAGELLGAARDENGNALKVYCGKTPPGSSAWAIYNASGIVINIDLSKCGFKSTPICIANLHGTSSHWATTGGSSPYNISNKGFSIYVRYSSDGALTPATANKYRWHIQWIAIGI